MNIHGWLSLGLTGLISLLSKGFKSVLSWKHEFFGTQPYYWKTTALTIWTFVSEVLSLLFSTLSRFVTAFLPRSKRLLVSWLQLPSSVILEPKNLNSVTLYIPPPIYLPWNDGTGCPDLSVLNVEFKASLFASSFTFIKRLFSFSSFFAIRVVSYAYVRLSIFLPAKFQFVIHPAQHFIWSTLHKS